MEIKDVLQCSFQNWYSSFKKVTPRSVLIPLPKGFVAYLKADSIFLPNSDDHVTCTNNNDSDASDDDDENWDSCDNAVAETPKFEEFDVKIKETIKELGGKVFPKLNWSSPRDATWIALNNSCCCTTVSDIYLLLKSSDFIMHDISQPFLLCMDYDSQINEATSVDHQLYETAYYLVLRKWIEINPDTEFRCFVKDGALIGICQRDATFFSDYNVRHKNDIVRDVVSFFGEHIQFRFPTPNYVFDIVRKKKDDIFLVDFNPFGEVTDSILFDWNELIGGKLTAGNNCLPEFRCVEHNRGVQPRPLNHYAIPKDIVDITTGEDSYKLFDLLQLKINEQNDSSSDDDDEADLYNT